jgi:TRAP-type transport system periplasmic protein
MRKSLRRGSSASRVAIALFAALTLAFAACGGDDEEPAGGGGSGDAASVEPQTLRFATFISEQAALGQMFKWYMDEVTERTDGAIEFEAFWDASLLGPAEILPGLKDGRIQAGHVQPAYYPGAFPLTSVVEIPFTATNQPAASVGLTKLAQENEAMMQEWETNGALPMGFGATPPSVLGSDELIDTFDKLKGKRIRTVGREAQAVEAAGGNPIALETGDVYESMERGLLDAYMGVPFDFVLALKLNEVGDYVTDPGLGVFAQNPMTIAASTWADLPQNVKDIMYEVGREMPAEYYKLYQPAEVEACKALKNPPVVWPEAEVEKWRSAIGTSIEESWAKDVTDKGGDADAFYQAYADSVTEAESEYPDYKTGVATCAESG